MLQERGRPVMDALQRMLSIVLRLQGQVAGAVDTLLSDTVYDKLLATRQIFKKCAEFLHATLRKFSEKTGDADVESLVLRLNFNSWLHPSAP